MVFDIYFVAIHLSQRWLNGKMRTKMHSQPAQQKTKFLSLMERRKALDVIVEDRVNSLVAEGLPAQAILEALFRLKRKYSQLYP